jgi:hypothetical protein
LTNVGPKGIAYGIEMKVWSRIIGVGDIRDRLVRYLGHQNIDPYWSHLSEVEEAPPRREEVALITPETLEVVEAIE